MKKFLLTIAMIAVGFTASAQEANGQTDEGKWVIEANTGAFTTGGTAFSFASSDGNSAWNLGLDGGYFIMEDLAIKAGLGYGSSETFSYKIGAEYYIAKQFPVSIDFTGSSRTGGSVNWIGLQGGYAYFLGENVSIKPALRYNLGLEDGQKGVFQGLIGFALHF